MNTRSLPDLRTLALTVAQLPYLLGGAFVLLAVAVLALVASNFLLRGGRLIDRLEEGTATEVYE